MRVLLKQIEPLAKRSVDLPFVTVIGSFEANGCPFAVRQVNICAKVSVSANSQFGRLACPGYHMLPCSVLNSIAVLFKIFHAE